VRELPTSPDVAGIVHGDPELDNVVWTDRATPVFVDLDDARRSWFGADVCFALRDFAERALAPEPHSEPVAAFLAGYRECRPLTDEEIEAFPLFARAHALITLARLTRGREERVSEEWPEVGTASTSTTGRRRGRSARSLALLLVTVAVSSRRPDASSAREVAPATGAWSLWESRAAATATSHVRSRPRRELGDLPPRQTEHE
jgi:Ser/Thr protein kinase RdoA (MazF antagonist)